MLKIGKNLIW